MTADTQLKAETPTAVLTLRDDGILEIVHKPADVTLADAEQVHAVVEKLVGERQILVLVDIRKARSISREARQFGADSRRRTNTKAQAMIIDSGISRVLGNFFLGLNRPKYPVHLFTSKEDAVVWLKDHEG